MKTFRILFGLMAFLSAGFLGIAQVPVASFTPASGPVSVCQYGCISFEDASTNAPTSWTWFFTSDGDIVLDSYISTEQNPTVCVIEGTSGNISASLIATNASGDSDPPASETYTATIDVCAEGCERMFNCVEGAAPNNGYVLYSSNNGGFVAGTNGFNDESKADYFNITDSLICTNGSLLTGILLWLDTIDTSPLTTDLEVAVWDGTGGTPGTKLGSVFIPMATVGANADVAFTYADFTSSPVTIPASGEFFAGITGLSTVNGPAGDSLGLVTNVDPTTSPATAWEEFGTGGWFPYDDAANSWDLSISHYIVPFILPSQDITANAPTPPAGQICDDGTAYTFTGSFTGTPCFTDDPVSEYFVVLDATTGLIEDIAIAVGGSADFTFDTFGAGDKIVRYCTQSTFCEQDCEDIMITVDACGTSCPPMITFSDAGAPNTEPIPGVYTAETSISTSGATTLTGATTFDAPMVTLNADFDTNGQEFDALVNGCTPFATNANARFAPPQEVNLIYNRKVIESIKKHCESCDVERNVQEVISKARNINTAIQKK